MSKRLTWLVALMVCAVAVGSFAADIENWSSTVNGTAKISTDGAGTATLTIDAAVIANQTISGDLTVTDDIICDDITVLGGDVVGKSGTSIDLGEATAGRITLTATNTTVTGTLGVTGVATFTAESVHNLGIDADYITTDAAAGIDTKTVGTLLVGAATADKVEIADNAVETEVQGDLEIQADIDTMTGVTMVIGGDTATKVEIADTGIETEVQGTLQVIQGATLDSTLTVAGTLNSTGTVTVGASKCTIQGADGNINTLGSIVASGTTRFAGKLIRDALDLSPQVIASNTTPVAVNSPYIMLSSSGEGYTISLADPVQVWEEVTLVASRNMGTNTFVLANSATRDLGADITFSAKDALKLWAPTTGVWMAVSFRDNSP